MTLSALYPSRNRLITYAMVAFMTGAIIINSAALLTPGTLNTENQLNFPTTLSRFTSYAELQDFVSTHQTGSYHPNYYWSGGIRGPMITFKGGMLEGNMDQLSAPEDYSTTNIQVEGVDEADIVKTDGNYIYIVAGESVHIIKSYPPEEAELISTIRLDRMPFNIFINGDKLIIMESAAPEPVFYRMPALYPIPVEQYTVLYVYDVSDRENPTLDRTITSEGWFVDTRMIGDYVYIVTQQGNILYNETEVWLPCFTDGNSTIRLEADMVYYHNVTDDWFSYTHIVAVNTQNPDEAIGHESFLMGGTSTLYASLDNIYLTAPRWSSESQTTKIFKVKVDGSTIEYTADGKVPGSIINQFSMSEHRGYFRIATQKGYASRSGEWTSDSNVYVLDEDLNLVGSVEGLAPGENMHSARFMGDRAYLVTFKKIDPLFTIDLSDPTNPKVLGKLKIPGYSDYLHPYDENTLIGIGKETVEAEDPDWDFAWYQGIKISLFDVSDVENPKELAKIEIGDRGSDTPALREHKSVLFSKDRNLLVIPILEAQISEDSYS
jgi:inhibitor of cysteine peptidase